MRWLTNDTPPHFIGWLNRYREYSILLNYADDCDSYSINQPWHDVRFACTTYRLNSRPQMWPSDLTLAMTLTLRFQGQRWNLLYLSPKRYDFHETKGKHVNRNLHLNCGQWVWHLLWPWPWISKVKYGSCYISAKNYPIATKRKTNASMEH